MDDRQLRALFRRPAQPLREQRVILAQEAADDEHSVECREFGDRHAQPRHSAGSEIRLAQAEVDIVAAEATRELLREMQFLERRVRRCEHAERARSVLRDDALEFRSDAFERGLPVRVSQCAADLDLRPRQAILGIEAFIRETVLVRDPAFVDGFVFERHHAHDAIVLDLHDKIAAQPVVRRNRHAPRQLPGARRIAKRL